MALDAEDSTVNMTQFLLRAALGRSITSCLGLRGGGTTQSFCDLGLSECCLPCVEAEGVPTDDENQQQSEK